MASIDFKTQFDAWVQKYIKQNVAFRTGESPTSTRLNELFNLLITQGDDTTQALVWVRDYLDAYLVEHTAAHEEFVQLFEQLKADTLADNSATMNTIYASNLDTAATIAADNLATKNAVIADNTATKAATSADRAYIDNQINLSGQVIEDAAEVLAAANNKASYDDVVKDVSGTAPQFNTPQDALINITKIEGATSQVVTTQGKNLVSAATYAASAAYGVAVYARADLKPNTQYAISLIIPAGESYYINENLFTFTTITGDGTRKSVVVTTAATVSTTDEYQYGDDYGWRIFKNNDGHTSSGTASALQIEAGATATAYAAFVPDSPSLNYPSAITNANNFDVVTCRKNLLPLKAESQTVNGITFTKNNDGSITVLGTATSGIHFVISDENIILRAGTYIGGIGCEVNQCTLNFKTNDEQWFIFTSTTPTVVPNDVRGKFLYLVYEAGFAPNGTVFPQISYGTIATTYEPYKGSSKPIPYELAKLPNGVYSTIETNTNGTLKYIKRVNTVVFDGSVDEAWTRTVTYLSHFIFIISLSNGKGFSPTSGIAPVRCSHFKANSSNNLYVEKSGIAISTDGKLYIYDPAFVTYTTVDQFKAWLTANPITVQYELATPIETTIPDIYLPSYKGLTNVYTTSTPQVNLVGTAKSELWAHRYTQGTVETAKGTATAILLNTFVLIDGAMKSFVTTAANGGVATTLNGIPIYKAGTTTPPTLYANRLTTVWYSITNNCFFLKASATGDVIAALVLAGRTFSNAQDTDLVGTMPNHGGGDYASIPQTNTAIINIGAATDGVNGVVNFKSQANGYVDSNTKFAQYIKNLRPENIKKDVHIGNDTMYMTGTGPTKKFASGTGYPTAVGGFALLNGSVVSTTAYKFTVTGLDFMPTFILIECTVSTAIYTTMYTATSSAVYTPIVVVSSNNTSAESGSTRCYKGNTNDATVYNGGFTLPVEPMNVVYQHEWYAFE